MADIRINILGDNAPFNRAMQAAAEAAMTAQERIASAFREAQLVGQRATAELNRSFAQVRLEFARGIQLPQIQTDTASLERLRRIGEQTFLATRTDAENARSKIAQLNTAFAAGAIDAETLARALREPEEELRRLRAEALRTGQSLDEIRLADLDNTNLRTTGMNFSSLAIGIAAATAAMAAFAVAGAAVVNQMAVFENLHTQLNSVMGSIKEGDKAAEWIKKMAAETPFQIKEVTATFMTLKNFGIDPTNGSLKNIADQASKTGKGFEGMRSISLALGQAWGKTKLQGDEIMQLIEAGVPAWALLSEATGKSIPVLQKMSEKGELGRSAIQGLMDAMGRNSIGAAAAQMDTFSGSVSNLQDSVGNVFDDLFKAGALTPFSSALKELTGNLVKFAKSQDFVYFTQSLVSNIKAGINAAGFLGDKIAGLSRFFAQHKSEILAVAAGYTVLKTAQFAAFATTAIIPFVTATYSSIVAIGAQTRALTLSVLASLEARLGLNFLTAAQVAEGIAAGSAATATAALGAAIALATGGLSIILPVIIAAGSAMAVYGTQTNAAADDADALQKANAPLAESIRSSSDAALSMAGSATEMARGLKNATGEAVTNQEYLNQLTEKHLQFKTYAEAAAQVKSFQNEMHLLRERVLETANANGEMTAENRAKLQLINAQEIDFVEKSKAHSQQITDKTRSAAQDQIQLVEAWKNTVVGLSAEAAGQIKRNIAAAFATGELNSNPIAKASFEVLTQGTYENLKAGVFWSDKLVDNLLSSADTQKRVMDNMLNPQNSANFDTSKIDTQITITNGLVQALRKTYDENQKAVKKGEQGAENAIFKTTTTMIAELNTRIEKLNQVRAKSLEAAQATARIEVKLPKPTPATTEEAAEKPAENKAKMPDWEAQLTAQKIAHEWLNAENGSFYEFSKQSELAFWDAKRRITGNSKEDSQGANRKYLAIMQSMQKDDFQQKMAVLKKEEEGYKFNLENKMVFARYSLAQIKAAHGAESKEAVQAAAHLEALQKQEQNRLQKLSDDATKNRLEFALARLDIEEKAAIAMEQVQGASTAAQLDREKAFMQARHALKLQGMQQELADAQAYNIAHPDDQNPEKVAQVQNGIEMLTMQHGGRLAEINRKSAAHAAKPWQDFTKTFQDGVMNSINSLIEGTQTTAQILSGFFKNMGKAYLNEFIMPKIRAFIFGEQATTAAAGVGATAKGAIEKKGMLESVAMSIWATMKKIAHSAYAAAAGAYQAIVSIPYVGPVLAPIAAGVALAGVFAIGKKIASARGGYDIPAGVNPMTQLHEQEMVLPKAQANVIRNLAAQAMSPSTPDLAANPAANHTINIQAIDAVGVARLFKQHGGAIVESLKMQGRDFKVT